jgi:transposase InsO family protein
MHMFSQFQPVFKHVQGKENKLADALSRAFEAFPAPVNVSALTRTTRQRKEKVHFDDADFNEEAKVRQLAVDAEKAARPKPVKPDQPRAPMPRKLTKEELKANKVRLARAPETWALPDEQYAAAIKPDFENGLLQAMAAAYPADPFFGKLYQDAVKAVQEHADEAEAYIVSGYRIAQAQHPSGEPDVHSYLLYNDFHGDARLCVPQATYEARSMRELFLEHAHTIIGHLGYKKLIYYASKNFWWPTLSKDALSYSMSCLGCQANKTTTTKPAGLHHSLATPPYPWHTMGIDFMGPFPDSSVNGCTYNFLCVCLDLFSGEVELVPCRQSCDAPEVASLYMQRIFPQHGLPQEIVSDADVRFTSAFWQQLHSAAGTALSMSSRYHPRSNGKTERMNRTVNSVMRQFVDEWQSNWAEQVPFVQFAINASYNHTTGYAPFELTRGYVPRTLPDLWNAKLTGGGSAPTRFVEMATTYLHSALDSILETRTKDAYAVNAKRRKGTDSTHRPKVGERVWLSTRNFSIVKNRARKWTPRFIGPFVVTHCFPATDTFELDLPARYTDRRIHNRFHIELLRPYVESDQALFPNRVYDQIPFFPLDEDNPNIVFESREVSHIMPGEVDDPMLGEPAVTVLAPTVENLTNALGEPVYDKKPDGELVAITDHRRIPLCGDTLLFQLVYKTGTERITGWFKSESSFWQELESTRVQIAYRLHLQKNGIATASLDDLTNANNRLGRNERDSASRVVPDRGRGGRRDGGRPSRRGDRRHGRRSDQGLSQRLLESNMRLFEGRNEAMVQREMMEARQGYLPPIRSNYSRSGSADTRDQYRVRSPSRSPSASSRRRSRSRSPIHRP